MKTLRQVNKDLDKLRSEGGEVQFIHPDSKGRYFDLIAARNLLEGGVPEANLVRRHEEYRAEIAEIDEKCEAHFASRPYTLPGAKAKWKKRFGYKQKKGHFRVLDYLIS